MDSQEQPTCGKGLAENLAAHMQALDLTDPNSRMEYDAYEKLVNELRQAATQLKATANRMAGYRDLPMGRHDHRAMTHPWVREAFEKFVERKRELSSLLEKTAEREAQLFEMMRAHSS